MCGYISEAKLYPGIKVEMPLAPSLFILRIVSHPRAQLQTSPFLVQTVYRHVAEKHYSLDRLIRASLKNQTMIYSIDSLKKGISDPT